MGKKTLIIMSEDGRRYSLEVEEEVYNRAHTGNWTQAKESVYVVKQKQAIFGNIFIIFHYAPRAGCFILGTCVVLANIYIKFFRWTVWCWITKMGIRKYSYFEPGGRIQCPISRKQCLNTCTCSNTIFIIPTRYLFQFHWLSDTQLNHGLHLRGEEPVTIIQAHLDTKFCVVSHNIC